MLARDEDVRHDDPSVPGRYGTDMLRTHRGAGFVASVALAMSLALSACGSDDDSDADTQPSATPTAQTDEQALEQLAIDLWDARKSAQNAGDASRERFEPILAPELIELEVGELSDYKKYGLTRQGGPEITDIEATVDGETGTVWMCLNEDDWPAFQNGTEIPGEKYGPGPYGFTAEKTDDEWLITQFEDSVEAGRADTC